MDEKGGKMDWRRWVVVHQLWRVYVRALLFRPEVYVCNLRVPGIINPSCVHHVLSRASPVPLSLVPTCRAAVRWSPQPGAGATSNVDRGRFHSREQRVSSSSPPVSFPPVCRLFCPQPCMASRTLLPRAGCPSHFSGPAGRRGLRGWGISTTRERVMGVGSGRVAKEEGEGGSGI